MWALLLLTPITALAQPYLSRRYAIEEGLVQSQVNTIYQDAKGYIWFGTAGGLSCFDGIHFESFTIDDGLVSNMILDIIEDADERLWIATPNGISIFDGLSFTSFSEMDGRVDRSVNDLLKTSSGAIWLATQSGVSHYDGSRFHHISTADGLPAGGVTTMVMDASEQLWMGTQDGLCVSRAGELQCYREDEGLPARVVNDVIVDRSGVVWVATPAGVASMDPAGAGTFSGHEDLASQRVLSLLEDEWGALWIGMQNGIVRINGEREITERWLDGSWIVGTFFEDRERNVWAGTSGRGAVQLQSTAFAHMNPILNVPEDVYLEVFADSLGVIWVGTLSNGVYRVEDNEVRHFDARHEPALRHIRHISQGRDGNLWIGGPSGIVHYDGNHFEKVAPLDGSSFPYVYSMHEDRDGLLWIASKSGLFRLEEGALVPIDLGFGTARQVTYSIFEDGERLWVATAEGLVYVEGDSVYQVSSLQQHSITTITKGPSGSYWLGTQGYGVFQFDPSSETVLDTVSVASGLNGNTVYFTLFDRLGHLWVGTNTGVNRLDMAAYWHDGTHQVRSFGSADGLVGLETNMDAATLDKEGKLWFGTIEGLMQYDAAARPVNDRPPPIYLTGIRLFLAPVSWEYKSSGQSFTHEENHITFDFMGMSFVAPEQLRYQYRLHGFDADWSPPTESRFATYANLPPGAYTFEVLARNSDGVASAQSAMYSFEVLSPYWQETWFLALATMIVLMCVAGVVQWRTNALNKRRKKLEDMVTERTKDLENTHGELLEAREAALSAAKAKSAFLSTMTHELRTPMNGILGMTELMFVTNLTDEQHDYAETIRNCSASMMELIEDVLMFADLAAGQRSAAIESFDLRTLLMELPDEIYTQAASKGLEIQRYIDPAVPATIRADKEHLGLILQHLVGNAVKFTSEGLILIAVERGASPVADASPFELLISIHDTGIGMDPRQLETVFEAFSQADMSVTRQFQGMGIGLALAQQMSAMLGGVLSAESRQGIGSTFRLAIPVKIDAAQPASYASETSELAGKNILVDVVDDRERRRLALICRSLGLRVWDNSNEETPGGPEMIISDKPAGLILDSDALLVPLIVDMTSDEGLQCGATRDEVKQVLHRALSTVWVG